MSTDDYNQEMEERARLIAEINAAKAELAMQIELNRQLRVDLQVSQAAAIESIKYSKALAASFIPLMNGVAEEVDDVKNILDEVKVAVQDLSKRYTSIKNVSTATKNLTQCDDIYQRKFRLYEKFRKVCLGYVIGIDSNIINSEALRTTLEKNYLANSDYWIAHCIMATMLWVNDEKDASDRALNKAMEIDPKRSTIFFLLVNLRFGRTEAAKKWYNLYMSNIDVNDIGEEWQYLLQAYLYKAFGHDKEFEQRINEEYKNLLEEVKKYSLNYEKEVVTKVFNFADAYPHRTNSEYELLKKYCEDYNSLLQTKTDAEKCIELAKFYNEVFETNPESQLTLSRRIEDILHNLISSYDDEEYEIIKKIKYNEYIIKARGDIQAASKMYKQEIEQNGKLSLIDLIYKFAFSDLKSNVDNLVRKFAISFLLDIIEKGYMQYRDSYKAKEIDKPTFSIDGCKFKANENTIDDARNAINTYYDKSKSKYIARDKKHKAFLICWIIGLVGIIGTMMTMIIPAVKKGSFVPHTIQWILLIVFMLMFGLFLTLSILRRKKVLEKLEQRRYETMKKMTEVLDELAEYHEDYKLIAEQYCVLQETLEKFRK